MVENTQKMVSIIMPAHNSEKYIATAINSVLNQTYSNFELIIILDNCSDGTESIVNDFRKNDKRIIVIKTKNNNLGAIGARNLGINIASGRFIAFLDSDDFWAEDKLYFQIKFMIENNYSFSYSNYYVLKGNNKRISYIAKNKINYKQMLKASCIGCSTVVYDKNALGKVYMPIDAYKREDYAAWLQILKRIDYAYNCDRFLATYRDCNDSVSSNKFKLIKYHWNVLKNVERLPLLYCVYYLISNIIIKLFKY